MPAPIIAAGLAASIGQAVVWCLRMYAVSLIVRVLATLGIGLFAYKFAVPEINSFIASKFNALPSFIRASVGASGIDVLVTMVVSAHAVRKTAKILFGRLGTD